ncbi:Retrovirus-related Pol polyprotein from transposon TNT 1-94 [Gossypium australe]|uniref:Retrovirus-related Pol polyprotein from transposon TNT 1-94 n=1 Tax=Gossypium australe TaxID=47621 RepID=A0A5B6WF00_9ROSI|nr:Retrovirus-related Pol polyprotein from transposon TNT 1-94 [Gossypium australe]
MDEFEMSVLGKMHYFLRLKTKNCKSSKTPSEFGLKLIKEGDGKKVNSTLYKQIVGNLMYLTAMRLDIMYMESSTKKHSLDASESY